jgi:cell wall-associated NlpC family hydrolase
MMGVRDDIVAYCQRMIGCAYDYTPSGGVEGRSYNCSFLTHKAYLSAGIEVPTWQGHQNGEGSQSDWIRWHGHWTIHPSELLPGDMVFFGTSPERTTHVGISLGGNRMIDSVPDGGVQERRLYTSFVGGGWPLPELPEVDMLSAEDKRWISAEIARQVDAVPRSVWGYRNDTCERKDIYQIVRDIRTTLGISDGQIIKAGMHQYVQGVIHRIEEAVK